MHNHNTPSKKTESDEEEELDDRTEEEVEVDQDESEDKKDSKNKTNQGTTVNKWLEETNQDKNHAPETKTQSRVWEDWPRHKTGTHH